MKILIGVLLFALNSIVQVIAWDKGYFDNDGTWQKWHYSCLTWDDSNSWLTCPDTRFLDENSGLWETWQYGEFYDSTLGICKSCNGRCAAKWAYLFSWFECPSDQYFDLTKMTWTQKCTATQVAINNKQLHSLKLWRDFKIYVNPDSKELIELGTIKYPYKQLGAAFVEIFNIHSHSNRSISVLISEKTQNILELRKNIIMNITQVSVDVYSEYNPSNPQRAHITVVETPVDLKSPSTVFSIMKYFDLKGKLLLH